MLKSATTLALHVTLSIERELRPGRNPPDGTLPPSVREHWIPLLDGLQSRMIERTKTMHSNRHVRTLVERKNGQ